jgi:hypothetical protein
MPAILRRKTKAAWTEAHFRGVNLIRPLADRAIGAVARSARMRGMGLMLIEGLWDHPYHWLRLAMLRSALSDRAAGLVGLYEEGTPGRVRRSLRAIGLDAEECIPSDIPREFVDEANRLLAACSSTQSIFEMRLPLDFPPHQLYDGALKSEELGTIRPDHPKLAAYLARLLHYLSYYQDLLARRDVRVVATSHPTFPRFSALIWCALHRNIPVFSTIHVNEHVSGRKFGSLTDYRGALSDRPSRDILDSLKPAERQDLIEEGRCYYSQIRSREIGQFSILDIYGAKRDRTRDELAALTGADPAKPNVVILTSCWSDGPNGAGPTYFTDYQDLLERMLAVIGRVKECNWLLRPHPAEFMYGNKMRLAKLVAGRLPSNAFLWPQDFSANAIPTVADCVVTPAGTSGIEYTALGLPVLVCRETTYTPWGFASVARDAGDLAAKLEHAWMLPAPTQRQREDAFIFMAMTFTSPPATRGQYLYQWGSKSWRIWPSLSRFISENRDSIDRETWMLRRWAESSIDSYNVFKWLHRASW